MQAGACPAHVAQSVEHFLGKEEVTGSSPVVGSIGFFEREEGLFLIHWLPKGDVKRHGEGEV